MQEEEDTHEEEGEEKGKEEQQQQQDHASAGPTPCRLLRCQGHHGDCLLEGSGEGTDLLLPRLSTSMTEEDQGGGGPRRRMIECRVIEAAVEAGVDGEEGEEEVDQGSRFEEDEDQVRMRLEQGSEELRPQVQHSPGKVTQSPPAC